MKTEVPLNSRREIKFVADDTEAGRLAHWLQLHPAGFRSPYPGRWINSIYFDSYHFAAYRQNLAGVSERTKVRYRWYGPDLHPGPGALEVKCKRNQFGWKLRYPVDRMVHIEDHRWRELFAQIMDRLPPQGRIWLLSNPQPAILVRYRRRYFETRDGRIRATIDEQQRVYDQRYKPYLNVTRCSNLCRTAVFELKFERGERETAAGILTGMPLRVSRNSKYVAGLRSVHRF